MKGKCNNNQIDNNLKKFVVKRINVGVTEKEKQKKNHLVTKSQVRICLKIQ